MKKSKKFLIEIKSAEIYGKDLCKLNKGIYASDHFAIGAEISIEKIEKN